MKKNNITLSLFVVIVIGFVCLNSFGKKEDHQDCQSYLVSKNSDLRHVSGITGNIIRDYQGCTDKLRPQGKRRPFMVDSYTNLIEYYQNSPQNFKNYKEALNQETTK